MLLSIRLRHFRRKTYIAQNTTRSPFSKDVQILWTIASLIFLSKYKNNINARQKCPYWEAKSVSCLRNLTLSTKPKVHKNPPLVVTLSQTNPAPSSSKVISLRNVLTSTSSKIMFSSRFFIGLLKNWSWKQLATAYWCLCSSLHCAQYWLFTKVIVVTYFIKQSPSRRAIQLSVSQENLHIFTETECSLPHSQVPAICPNPEPDESSPCSHIPLPKDPLNMILPSTPGSSKWSLSFRFTHQNPVYPLLTPYLLHDSPASFFSIWSTYCKIDVI